MDGVFSLPEGTRADFVRSLMHSFGCSYICLWHPYDHSPSSSINSRRLFFLDGAYNDQNVTSSSSPLGSNSAAAAAQSLFYLYQRLIFDVNNDECVPGIAFSNHMPFLDLQQPDLLKLASPGIQTQFYQAARIERAVFMGCKKGEIELGFSEMHQIDIQAALTTLFPEDFCRQISQQQLPIDQHHQQQNDIINNNTLVVPSSSNNSSSWITLSTSTAGSLSPECSSLMFPTTTNAHHIPPPGTSSSQLSLVPNVVPPMQTTFASAQFIPTPEAEQEAIIKAILHVISSPPSLPPITSHHYNLSNYNNNPEASAFKMYYNYRPHHQLGSNNNNNNSSRSRQSLMKRSIAFSRNLHLMRMRERFQFQAARQSPTSQLHHTISERTRREKLNQKFQALRALLPPATKNVKASILIAAKETLKSLIAEIEELNMRNQQLTTLLMLSSSSSSSKEAATTTSIRETSNNNNNNNVIIRSSSLSDDGRLNVRVSDVPGPSSSEERMVDLQVIVRSVQSSAYRQQADTVIRLLEFLKRIQNVRLISMDANTLINQLNFRLRIVEGSEWDGSAFEEAVRRVVADYLPNTLN